MAFLAYAVIRKNIIKDLTKNTPANKIFDAINSFSSDSEIRYVGGCVRKIINKEKVDDIDLATNLDPQKVCEALKENISRAYILPEAHHSDHCPVVVELQ